MSRMTRPTGLRATTCLGANTNRPLRQLVDRLTEHGVDIEFDETVGWSEREVLFGRGEIDLVWACGLLTVRNLDAGLPMQITAAPIFAGEVGPCYRSAVVHRVDSGFESIADTFAGRLAINELGSWSGYVGFDRWLRSIGHSLVDYEATGISGSHYESMAAVRDGTADVAAIDQTIWAARDEVEFPNLRCLTVTADWPAPPISLSPRAADLASLIVAEPRVDQVRADEVRPDEIRSGLIRFVPTTGDDYRFMVEPHDK